jgi:plasmid stabilization system protein ParE
VSDKKRRLEWTATAERNLADIEAYYLDKAGECISDAAVDAIYYQVEKIHARPLLYRKGALPGVHESVMARFPFIVIYRVRPSTIQVLRILHQRQAR